jgi:hypothetical protein
MSGKVTPIRQQAELLDDNVITFPAPGKRQAVAWPGQDFRTALEWFQLVRARCQDGMEVHQAVNEAGAAITADRLSKSGKGKH